MIRNILVVFQSLTCVWLFLTPWAAAHQASLPSLFPEVSSNSCPSSWWCHPTISSSIIPFSFCPQSFPESGSFPMSPFLASGGQSIGASALASVLPMNIHYWFPLGLTGLISLLSNLHFSFAQISQTIVQSGCATLCSHQQCIQLLCIFTSI